MNKVGDFLKLIKEIPPPKYTTISEYTVGERYKIMYINDKKIYYITNDNMSQYINNTNKRTDLDDIQKNKK